MVPAHRFLSRTLCTPSRRALRPTFSSPQSNAFGTITLLCLFICFVSCLPLAAAQQIYTQALAIIDAPQKESIYHVGSALTIAIDVSGNGKLPSTAFVPGSGLPTRFDFFEMYLVSSEFNLNMTVSQGSGFLTQEAGSTVKHMDYNLPSCLPTGGYNLTLYEGSTIDSAPYYTITPIPLKIQNSNQSGDCKSSSNPLQSQPQASSPPSVNPWNGNTQTKDTVATTKSSTSSTLEINNANQAPTSAPTASTPTVAGAPTSAIPVTVGQGLITVTVGPSGLKWPFTLTTVLPSASPGATITRTLDDGPTTMTVVFVSEATQTLTTNIGGQLSFQTTTVTSLSTTTAVMENGSGDTAGFFPVNAGIRTVSIAFWGWTSSVIAGLSLVLLRCL